MPVLLPSTRKVTMDSVIRVCLLLVMLFGVGSIGIWLVTLICRVFSPPEPDTIAPFILVGQGSTTDAQPLVMARLLSARLLHLNSEIRAVNNAVSNISSDYEFPSSNESAAIRPATKMTQSVPAKLPPPAPSKGAVEDAKGAFAALTPIKVDLKVGNIELNGLVAWMQSYLAKPTMIEVTVHYIGTEKALVAATFGQSPDTVWRQVEKEEGQDIQERIIAEIAYAYWYQKVSSEKGENKKLSKDVRRENKSRKSKHSETTVLEKVKALPVARFQSLIETLSEFARLQAFETAGRRVPGEWSQVSKDLARFIAEVPDWDELLPVAEQAAHRAMEYQEQLRLARIEQALLQRKDLTSARLNDLKTEIGKLEDLLKEPTVIALTGSFPTNLERETLDRTLDLPVDWKEAPAPANGQHPASSTSVSGVVSIVGRQPFPGILGANVSIVGEGGGWTSDYDGRVYSGALGSVVKYLAPKAPLRIINIIGVPTAESLVRTLKRVGESRSPQVLLYAYGPSSRAEENDLIFAELIKLADQGTICVVAAGDSSEDSAALLRSAEILKKCIVVAAVDDDGVPTSEGEHLLGEASIFWSYGSRVPVRIPTGIGTDNWGGTGPAAAITAGCISRLITDCPTATSTEIIGTLRETARVNADGGGPPVMQFASARKKLNMLSNK